MLAGGWQPQCSVPAAVPRVSYCAGDHPQEGEGVLPCPSSPLCIPVCIALRRASAAKAQASRLAKPTQARKQRESPTTSTLQAFQAIKGKKKPQNGK